MKTHYLNLTLGSRSHKMLPQYPHHMIYAPVKIEVATYHSLGGYAFTRKYYYLTLGSTSAKVT